MIDLSSMPQGPPLWMCVLWAAWAFQAWASAGLVAKFHSRVKRRPRRGEVTYRPPVVVIVPFKGVDADLAAGVRGLCEQDYPDYRLMLVVDSEADPAYEVLRRETARYPHRAAEVLVAGPAGRNEGQKVHNQLFAIDLILRRPRVKRQAMVFADSDAVPGPGWLVSLVGPLRHYRHTGVTTGYRWLIPTDRAGVWSHLASVMNSSVACLYGRDEFNHAWGGSMALRRRFARVGKLRDRLEGALCDDYQFSRMCRDLQRRVYFVPKCLVATPVRFTFSSLMNFAHRQYLLTRVYAPGLFATALGFGSLFVAGFFSAWGAAIYYLVREPERYRWAWPLAAIALVFVAHQLRAKIRRRVIETAFGPEVLERLGTTLRFDRWATPLWMTLHWLIVVRTLFGRTMNWRGITYRLYGPQKCERLD